MLPNSEAENRYKKNKNITISFILKRKINTYIRKLGLYNIRIKDG